MNEDRRALLRLFALLIVGGLALHELRYLLAFGSHAGDVAAAQGHAYLALTGPLLGLIATSALACLVLRSATTGTHCSVRAVRVRRLWPLLSVGLLVLFVGQELLEGALTVGHPSGFDAVLGGGGWIAAPLSVLVGGAIAVSVRVVARFVAAVRATHCRRPCLLAARPAAVWAARVPRGRRRLPPLARHLAGRAPPLPV
ncbi:MAG: hypothetical protein JWO90_491 [Solirubrobacterales bacterium]|jgi:hypothetical protein|nr:hypothetical protein [Solirubrobacterales bacterium]